MSKRLEGGYLTARPVWTAAATPGIWSSEQQFARIFTNGWPAIIGDTYSSLVSLLLYMDGNNNSTTFTDSSLNNLSVTANGNARISTVQSKFGGASGYFDGTGDYLAVGNSSVFDYGSGDFTIEYWAYFASASEVYVYSKRATSANYTAIACGVKPSAGTLYVIFAGSTTGSTWNINGTFSVGTIAIPLNTWTHLAYVRSGSTIKAYVNGVGDLTVSGVSGSLMSNTANVSIAATDLTGSNSVNGYIDDLRITKGFARYTANFTPPTAAGFIYNGYSDPYFASTSLLLHMDGTAGSTTFTDSSLNALTVTASGQAKISTTQSRFGNSSLELDGDNDFLTIATNALFDFSGDFTVELFARFNSLAAAQTMIGRWGASQRCFLFGVDSATSVTFVTGNNGSIDQIITRTPPVTLSTNTWYHFAATRSGSTVRFFVNGTQAGADATATGNCTGTQSMKIGVNGDGDVSDLNGFIDEVRITKGVARYTANFTPPPAQFTP